MFNDNAAFNTTPKGIQTYVGSAPVKILAINPSEDKLKEIIGDAASKFDTTYRATPSMYNDNKPSKPVVMWITDSTETVSPTAIYFNLIDSPRLSKADQKPQFFNGRVGATWAIFGTLWGFDYKVGETIEKTSAGSNNKYTDNVLGQVRLGEEDYYNFLYTLLKWGDPLTFIEGLKSEKLDFDSVFNGETEGIENLVNLINEKDLSLMGIFTTKISDDGRARQSFSMNNDTWFPNNAGKLTQSNLDRLADAVKSGEESGYPIIKDKYTFDPLVEYSEKVVVKTEIVSDNVDEFFDEI